MIKKILVTAMVIVFCFGSGAIAGYTRDDGTPLMPEIADTGTRISLDFRDADLKEVLKLLSQQSGLNFIPSEDIRDKKITLYLENVPVKIAIDSITAANGLTYDQGPAKNILIVRPSGAIKVKTITKIYSLNFAQVSSLASASTTSSNYSLGGSEDSSFGGKQSNGSSASTATGNVQDVLSRLLSPAGSIVVDQRTNSLVITEIPERFEVLEDMLRKLDTPTPEIFIEAEIIETTVDVVNRLGMEVGDSNDNFSAIYAGAKKDFSFPFSTDTFKGHGQTPGYKFGTLSISDLSVVIKALVQDSNTKYLARPRLLTLNNEVATIEITSDTYVGSVTTSTPTTQQSSVSAERMPTGVSLRVTPQVNASSFVTMFLEPSVSRTEIASNPEFLNPIKRSAKAKVMVKDGETIFIGGLLDSQKTNSRRKIPFLGDLPIAGALFKSDAKEDRQTEILIFITPHIVKTATASVADVTPLAPAAAVPAAAVGALIAGEAAPEPVKPVDERTEAIDSAVKELEKK